MRIVWPAVRWLTVGPLLPASFTAGVQLGQPVACMLDGGPPDLVALGVDPETWDGDMSIFPAVCWDDPRFAVDDYIVMRAVGLADDATIAALAADPQITAALTADPDDPAWPAVLEGIRAQLAVVLADEFAAAAAELDNLDDSGE